VEQILSEQFVRFVHLAQLEAIEPDACAALANVHLERTGPNG